MSEKDNKLDYCRRLESRLRAAEQQLQKQELFFKQVAVSAPVAFIIADDRTGDVLYFSHRFCEIWQLEGLIDELEKGMVKYTDLMEMCRSLVKNREAFNEIYLPTGQKKNSSVQNDLELSNGRIIRSFCCVINESKRSYLGRLCVFEDVTLLKRLNKDILDKKRLECIDILTGTIADSFQDVLRTISNHAAKVYNQQEGFEAVRQELDTIDQTLLKSRVLTNQMRVFAERAKPKPVKMLIAQILSELLNILRENYSPGLTIEQEIRKGLPEIFADKEQILKALLCICLNSIEAMPDEGKLTISAVMMSGETVKALFDKADFKDYIRIDIRDNGKGMDKQTLSKVYDLFFTTKGSEKGSGLGLPIAKEIIEAHQGHIKIESSLGNGTLVLIYLPVSPNVQSITKLKTRDEKTTGNGATILLVEDEDDLRQCLKEFFEMEGYLVITAPDGESGLKEFEVNKDRISLVLTDKDLPGSINGEELIRQVRDIKPQQKCILASGLLINRDKSDDSKNDIVYMQKSHKMDVIIKKVRELLDR